MLNEPPNSSKEKEPAIPQLNFFKRHLAQAVAQEVFKESATTKVVTIADKAKNVILPSLFASGLGVLAIKYPHFFDNFDPSRVSGGIPGFVLTLLVVLFLKFSWNQVGGSLAIALSLLAIVWRVLPNQQKSSASKPFDENTSKTWRQRVLRVGVRAGMNAGEDYIQQQRDKHSKPDNH